MITTAIQSASQAKSVSMKYYTSGQYAEHLNREIDVGKNYGQFRINSEILTSLYEEFAIVMEALGYKMLKLKAEPNSIITEFSISWD